VSQALRGIRTWASMGNSDRIQCCVCRAIFTLCSLPHILSQNQKSRGGGPGVTVIPCGTPTSPGRGSDDSPESTGGLVFR
jgi:hypothetical protein